ncbi:long-chain fatty acid--CoA ligase [Sphingomonas sp. Root50]|nr:long-chain fatty acid--CoA ligase [Sphingomonas sp. Root1294]KQY65874.1 long-chain fatty acid--CoA ligase [Sphingomonas sp. Root50]KRB95552.1 long-chain fatty acid--CoA ligase [Sphingomonas sp. Root720]
MQDHPLQISALLRYSATAHPEREIVSRQADGSIFRYDNRTLADRAAQVANMLQSLGITPGDFVSSLAWNTHRHLELFYAVPGIGAVLHTANPRLSDEHIAYTINHAGSRILLIDESFVDLVARLLPRLTAIETVILLGCRTDAAIAARSYETLLRVQPKAIEWPWLTERSGAFLCYTSGTTGDPKGVLYSHRSIVMHAYAAGLSGALGFSAFDCVMPCQSLYHATAWGLPFAAAINGCKIVLPGDRMDGASLQELIQAEGVTFSGGVPTIWTMYLEHLRQSRQDTGRLNRIVIGGSAVPRAMADAFRSHGVEVRQLWGMTETSPLGVVASATPAIEAHGPDERDEIIWTRQGRLQFGIELRIVDEEGCELPHDGQSPGALYVRGPWTVERYFKSGASAVDQDGWFDTGDIATIDADGFMRITDRSKDVIKSGGEWVSSIDLENAAMACPGVKIAAVIGAFHPKWEERPVLVVETHAGEKVSEDRIMSHLADIVVKWWMPDRIIFDAIPLTATGKVAKKDLRERYANCLAD